MATFFGYYFLGVIGFSALSAITGTVYYFLMLDEIAGRYPDAYQSLRDHRPYELSPIKRTRRFVALVRGVDDPKLNSLLSKYIFCLKCTISLLITAPVGMLVFLILVHSR